MSQKSGREMSEHEAFTICRKAGVIINEKNIHRGSYSMKTWGAIDCLINYHKYKVVAPTEEKGA
jgi:hypothetical protein